MESVIVHLLKVVQSKSQGFLSFPMVCYVKPRASFTHQLTNFSEMNGFIEWPYPPNGYFNSNNNNYYFYNGAPTHRPPKMRRRKRFLNPRNSQSQSQHHSAAETTDYSEDENVNNKQRYKTRSYHQQTGWMPQHNQYQNGKYHKVDYFNVSSESKTTKNILNSMRTFKANRKSPSPLPGSNLNVDVQEFVPRIQPSPTQEIASIEKSDLQKTAPKVQVTNAMLNQQSKSKSSTSRVTKKEIIESIKSMEQQNIDLMATKVQQPAVKEQDVEWNVIKKGKKIKVLKDAKAIEAVVVVAAAVAEVKVEEKTMEQSMEEEKHMTVEPLKKPQVSAKNKKSKNKNKKKKTNMATKHDGFEIIEPEFGAPIAVANDQEEEDEEEEEEEDELLSTGAEQEIINETAIEMHSSEMIKSEDVVVELAPKLRTVESEPKLVEQPETVFEETEIGVAEVQQHADDDDDDDAVIHISDEDICKTSLPLESFIEKVVEQPIKVKQQEIQATPKIKPKKEPEVLAATTELTSPFQDGDYFQDRNIADLERDLRENLRLLDDEIDIRSPIINPLHDFPITSAVRKWLQAKQNESFDSLFHMHNLKKLGELYEELEEDDSESDISEGGQQTKSTDTDSDYASDIQTKVINGSSPTSCSSNHAKASNEMKSTKCNKLLAAKESFCALM